MKKFIIAISILVALGLNVNAQNYQYYSGNTDGFFTSPTSGYRTENETPGLPMFDALGNQSAPLGSGWLLLAGMGVGYAMLKRKKD